MKTYSVQYGYDKLKQYTGTVKQINALYDRLLMDRDTFVVEIHNRATGNSVWIPIFEHRAFNNKRLRGPSEPVITNIKNLTI